MTDVAKLIENLNDDDEVERRVAVADLIDSGRVTIAPLVRALEDSRPRVRGGAASALGSICQGDMAAIAALTTTLGDPIPHVRKCAATALTFVGVSAVPALVDCLSCGDAEKQSWAAHALGEIGPAALEAAPALRSLMSHSDPSVRINATTALVAIGLEDDTTLGKDLIAALRAENYRHAEAIVVAIHQGGEIDNLFLPVYAAWRVGDDQLRAEAKSAIRQLDPNFPGPASGEETINLPPGNAAGDFARWLMGLSEEEVSVE